QKWGNKYPWAGYGQKFILWLGSKDPKPYGSWGNGSAMRVSSVGWLYDTLDETRRYARLSAEISHNHPEGIKGAECTAAVIFMARTGASKEEIADYIDREFGYDYSETLEEMRLRHQHVESCQDSLPKALRSFFDGESYEDVVRNAVSLGGDTDTLAAIAGAMGEAFYGMSDELKAEARKRVGEDMVVVLDRFDEQLKTETPSFRDGFLEGNELIEAAIDKYYTDGSKDDLVAVLDAIRQRMHADGHFIHPVLVNEENENEFAFRTLTTKDGKVWNVAFTSHAEYKKGESSHVMSNFIDTSMKFCLESKADGFIINPWSQFFLLTKKLMEMIFKADGDVEYRVPDDEITAELLEDGSFLKRATEICNRNHTQLNLIKLARILRDSWVWVPCTAIFSDADTEAMDKVVLKAAENNDLDSLVGHTFTSQDEVRMVPDILQSGDNFFFPVFTTAEEMGEYGNQFSKMQRYFLETMVLARNNEKNVKGIVINAFSEPFEIPVELFDIIAGIKSSVEDTAEADA
ncbi:MAG: ADP-ribosylglycohydrolase family protein, partial [Lachnospiraceae bacterium]|nr:ADP-ribosylglycohydrolase family protein [Lachnospiraceae bacterium]